jgi:integrase
MSVFIKRPLRGGRKTFAVIQRDKSGKNITVKSEYIDSINKSFLAGEISFEKADNLMRRFVSSKKPAPKKLNHTNEQILNRYWNAHYEGKDIAAPKAAFNRLRRAIRAIDPLLLTSCTKHEIEGKIYELHTQRESATVINQLFKFLGREERIRLRREEPRAIRFISMKDYLTRLRPRLPVQSRLVCDVALATGARPGELFAIDTNSLREYEDCLSVYIDRQLTETGIFTATKTRKSRIVPVIPELRNEVKTLAVLPLAEKRRLRIQNHSKNIRAACNGISLDSIEQLRDLRHSYAIHLLKAGVSISLIAQSLGNSVSVCEDYYTGFSLTSESTLTIARKLMALE